MAGLTQSATNFNGRVAADIYMVMNLGWDLVANGLIRVESNVRSTLELKKMKGSGNPLATPVDDPSSANATGTTTFSGRTLTVAESMILEDFNPDDFFAEWPEFASVGDLTNLRLQPDFLSKFLEIVQNDMGDQLADLFWQGDIASGTPALARMNGILKLAIADGDVVDVAGAANLTTGNIIEKLGDVWQAIPDKMLKNPDVKIGISYTDYKKLQIANNTIKQTTVGVLDQTIKDMFLTNKIIPINGLPEHVIVSTIMTNDLRSNLVFGYWVDPEKENPIIAKFNNLGRDWGVRIDVSIGAQYREGTEFVLYDGR